MKVKIKGLVFVGFAAAILSANAMADDTNTVTSKSYVDNKFQVLSGIQTEITNDNKNSETLYPSMLALTTGLDAVEHQNTVTGANYVTADVQSTGTTVGLDTNQMTTTYTDGTPLSTTSTHLVTEGVVAKAIADASDVDNFISQTVGTATDKAPSENAVNTYVTVKGVKVNGTALTPDTNKDVDVTVAEGQTDGTIRVNSQDVAVHNAEVTTHKLVQGTNTGSVITSDATDTQYPSALAVYNALTDTSNVGNGTVTATQNGVTVGTFNLNQAGNGSIAILKPDWDQATTTAADYIANKPTIQIAGNSIGAATNATSEQKNLPTSYAVKEYVQSITNGNTIPGKNPAICDATGYAPCALVAESDGLHWRTMATANHAGGVLGDAQ